MEMVRKNAMDMLKQDGDRILKENRRKEEALEKLRDILNLEKTPYRIEAFDISNIAGVNSVGSMVVFEYGRPKKVTIEGLK